MLATLPETERDAKALSIFNWLTELSANKGHDHHIHYEECEKEGLTIERLENPEDKKLQDLALTVHHCFMFALSNTPAFKIIENHNGRRWMKIQVPSQTIQFVQPPLIVPQPISPPN